jgi:hypothetical protein
MCAQPRSGCLAKLCRQQRGNSSNLSGAIRGRNFSLKKNQHSQQIYFDSVVCSLSLYPTHLFLSLMDSFSKAEGLDELAEPLSQFLHQVLFNASSFISPLPVLLSSSCVPDGRSPTRTKCGALHVSNMASRLRVSRSSDLPSPALLLLLLPPSSSSFLFPLSSFLFPHHHHHHHHHHHYHHHHLFFLFLLLLLFSSFLFCAH